jgi:putative ABC transport system permease protein
MAQLREADSTELDTRSGRRTFSILHLLEPQGIARVYGGNLVVMDVAAAEDVFTQREFVSRVDVVVALQASIDAVRSAIEAALPAGLRVSTTAQRKLDLQNVMRSFGMLLRGIGLVGLVVAYLIAFNGVSCGFEQRGWQLGVLAAIGARPRAIWWEQMREAPLLAVASVVLGLGGRARPPPAAGDRHRDGAQLKVIAPETRLMRHAPTVRVKGGSADESSTLPASPN